MRKIKFIIPLLILFLTIGFAAVNFSLSINGDTEITGNLDNFNVYFSRALVNGETNNSVVSSKTQLDFSGIIDKVGNTYTIEYDVTNASTLFDAEVTVKCTPSSEYLLVQNTFNVSSNLSALETRTGTLLLKKLKTISNDSSIYKTITCEIVATPVERESEVTGTIAEPLNPTYIGREIAIGEEKFNVISSTEDTVTMLAQYNISDTTYKQTEKEILILFNSTQTWTTGPNPEELDIQEHGGDSKNILNNYIAYLKDEYNIVAEGNFVTLAQLENLGCDIPTNYESVTGSWSCSESQYNSWIINDQAWWTRSSLTYVTEHVWGISSSGLIQEFSLSNAIGVRPTITIPIELYTKLVASSNVTYSIGREISIGEEKFNVISDNGLTVTMLAKYNIGTDNRQSDIENIVSFSSKDGWEYAPGPKEIDIQTWGGESKNVLNQYIEYLNTSIGVNVSGDLIALTQLSKLGCTIPSDYAWDGYYTCLGSEYDAWLDNGQGWWTKSAYTDFSDFVYAFGGINSISATSNGDFFGIRPTITIDKETLNYIESLGNYEIGEEISIEEEKFNVISQTATTVTMLAQYNLGADFKQTTNEHYVTFSDGNGWEYTPAPKEIDIDIWSSNPKNYVKGYVSYLENITKDSNINGNLLTLSELKELGCVIPSSYGHGSDEDTSYRTCKNSQYVSWLKNGHSWWLRSAYSWNDEGIWRMHKDGDLYGNNFANSYGIRPTITISKETLKYLASQKKYEVGQEVSIGDEKFNVISDNGTTISMLAQYNLGADFKQTTAKHYVNFSDGNGWEYTPGPKEIDIQDWSTNPKIYVNTYLEYLKAELGDDYVTGNLITIKQLGTLGCTIPIDYGAGSDSSARFCTNSPYKSWLINGQFWWTRSAHSNNSSLVWRVWDNGQLDYSNYGSSGGIRPVITIAKSAL